MKYRFLIGLVLFLSIQLLAVSYTPLTTPTEPSMASVRRLATTTADEDDVTEGEIPGRWADTDDIEDEIDIPNPWADPSPLGSPWPLLLFAAAYAAYGAVRLRRRKLSANE